MTDTTIPSPETKAFFDSLRADDNGKEAGLVLGQLARMWGKKYPDKAEALAKFLPQAVIIGAVGGLIK